MKKEHNDFEILKTVEADSSISQRKLSSQMALNVASVNFALQRLVKKGCITMVGENPRRMKYFITPKGLKEKTQLAYKFFGRNINYYNEVRSDIEARIIKATNDTDTGIAIYGVCELAEIAYMVVSGMSCNFLGFFLEDSQITNKKIINYNVQSLELLKGDQKCLLLLTDKLAEDVMFDMATGENIDTLNLVNYYVY